MERVNKLIEMYPAVNVYKKELLDNSQKEFKISDYNEILIQESNGSFFDFIFRCARNDNLCFTQAVRQTLCRNA